MSQPTSPRDLWDNNKRGIVKASLPQTIHTITLQAANAAGSVAPGSGAMALSKQRQSSREAPLQQHQILASRLAAPQQGNALGGAVLPNRVDYLAMQVGWNLQVAAGNIDGMEVPGGWIQRSKENDKKTKKADTGAKEVEEQGDTEETVEAEDVDLLMQAQKTGEKRRRG